MSQTRDGCKNSWNSICREVISCSLLRLKEVWMIVQGRRTGYSGFKTVFIFLVTTWIMNLELCCKCSRCHESGRDCKYFRRNEGCVGCKLTRVQYCHAIGEKKKTKKPNTKTPNQTPQKKPQNPRPCFYAKTPLAFFLSFQQ